MAKPNFERNYPCVRFFLQQLLATVAGAVAVANAEVSISGSVEWRYMSVSDDDTAQASDSDFQATNDITISMSSTTDNGLTISQYINIGNGAVGTSESSISGDFGTIAFNQDSGGAHAASSFDVTSGGLPGGHGDPSFTLYDGSGSAVTKVEIDEAQIDDSEDGALNYFSPTFAGFQFGFGTSHLDHADDNTSTSMGAKYSGSMGDVSYSVGYASYDGTGTDIEGTHTGVNVSFSGLSLGAGSSTNKDGNALRKKQFPTVLCIPLATFLKLVLVSPTPRTTTAVQSLKLPTPPLVHSTRLLRV